MPFLTQQTKQPDNHSVQVRRACSILMELVEKAAEQKMHGEVGITIHLTAGEIRGMTRHIRGNEK